MTTRIRSVAGVIAAGRFEDPDNARTILLMAGGLVALAVLVTIGTVWWWRTSEVEHPALGPLEVMGTRKWWKADYAARRRGLDGARPFVAEADDAPVAEPVDLAALGRDEPPQFDDLAEDDGAAALDAGTLDALMAAISSDRDSQAEFVADQLAEVAEVADAAEVADSVESDGAASEGDGDVEDVMSAPADPLLPVQPAD